MRTPACISNHSELPHPHVDAAGFQQEGFLKIPGLIDKTLIGSIRSSLDHAVKVILGGAGEHNQLASHSYGSHVFLQCFRPSQISAVLRDFALGPPLAPVLKILSQASDMRLWFDQALYKLPHANPTAWHLDQVYWPFSDSGGMTVWLPLDDVSESTGCLFYLPGSHRRVIPLRPKVANLDIEHNFDALMEIYPELRSIEPIAVGCSAGDVIVHSGLTAHAAAPNISTSMRRAYSLSYMPATATYNGLSSGLRSEYRNSLQPGDLLDNDSLFPKLYSH